MSKHVILDSVWFSSTSTCYGIVAIKSGKNNNGWKAYLGEGSSIDISSDCQRVASSGAKLPKAIACAAFSQLSPDDFKH